MATFAFFALNGFLMGMWIVHIPAVEQRTGVSHATLGWLLLLLGAGAVLGMRLCGRLTDRLGARRVLPAGAALCSAAVVLPGLATNAVGLGAALFVLGLGNGSLDVAMNTHAVQVERAYARPLMSAFHAVFSLGGILAAGIGAATIGVGWGVAPTLTAVAIVGLVTAAVAAGPILPSRPAASVASDGSAAAPAPAPAAAAKPRAPRGVWYLAALAFMLMLCEGVANDWSVLHLKDVLDAPAQTAALAYGAFAATMTIGRLLADRVVQRLGPVAVVRYGAALAALGLTIAALAPWIPLALAGWAVFGIGLSGCVPQFFSAAGHLDQNASGLNVSRVAGLGYFGMLAGPAVIGPLTHVMPLNLTFFLPVALCVVAAGAAGILRPTPRPANAARAPLNDAAPAAR